MKKVISVLLSVLMATSIISGLNLTAFAAGNSIVEATEIQLGQTVNSAITETNDVDWYKFTTPSSGKITVNVVYGMKVFDALLFQGENLRQVGGNSCIGKESANAAYSTYTIKTEAIQDAFYLKISKYGSYYYGNYSVTVNFESANESFCESSTHRDDSFLTANTIDLNKQYNGQIANDNDVDYYKFTITSSGKIDFSITSYVYTFYSSEFEIYDSEKNTIKEIYFGGNNTNGKTEYITKYLTAGTYYLYVKGQTGNYSFKVDYSYSPESFPESSNYRDDSILNANAISLNKDYFGQIANNDDDYYMFKISKKTVATLDVKYEGNLSYNIYNSKGETTKYLSSNGGNGKRDVLEIMPGTYYLKFTGSEQNYSFKLFTPKKPAKAKLNKLTASKGGKIKAIWSKTKSASGYQIAYSKSKSFKKTIATKTVSGSKKTFYTGKNFTKGKKYYVRVRAYKNYNGKKVYGSWSNVKSVKAK